MVNSSSVWRFYLSTFVFAIPLFDVPPTPIKGIAVSGFLALPVLISIPFKANVRVYYKGLILFLLFISWYISAAAINISRLADKAPNHIAYYLITFLVYYVVFSYSFDYLGIKKIQKLLYCSMLLIAVIGTIEISFYFLYGFDAYASFMDHGSNVGTFASIFPRMRSTFDEPSHLALYVIGVMPIIWHYNKASKVVVLYTLFLTFSTSALFGICAALILYVLWSIVKNVGNTKVFYFVLLAGVLGLTLFYSIDTVVFSKIFDVREVQPIRYLAFVDSIPYIKASPVYGFGPAYYYTYYDYGLFNLYLQLLVESGIIGLLLFLTFIFSHFKFVLRTNILFISFFSIFFQYIGMNHYYIPGLWLLLVYSYKRANKAI